MNSTTEIVPPSEESTDLHIKEDLTAAAGMLVATGDVAVEGRVCSGAKIRAAGNVRLSQDAQNAQIVCGAEVQMPSGAVVGGRISAYRGITCRSAGHRTKIATELFIGFDDQYLDLAEHRIVEIQNTLQKATQIRTQLDRLNHAAIKLTADQKEQMTSLLFSAAAAEKRAQAAIEQWTRNLTEPDACTDPVLIVNEMLFAGVMIHFPGAWTSIETSLKGPIQLSPTLPSAHGKKIAVQVTELATNKSFVLPSGQQPSRRDALRGQLETLAKGLVR